MAKELLVENFSERLEAVKAARVEIHAGDGNLTIDRLTTDEQVLVSGTLEYFENQGLPQRTLAILKDQATFTLKGGSAARPWLRFPWATCNGATTWQIHFNPEVSADITAHSEGGNVRLDLAGMAVTRLATNTGGGNVRVVLPDKAAGLHVEATTGAGNVTVEMGSDTTGINTILAKSGAGNVEISIPPGLAARIIANSGMGKVLVDSRIHKINQGTYQSPDFEQAADKVEITANSGAGNVKITSES